MLTVAVARSSSDDNAIFLVLWMTSCLPAIGEATAMPIGHILLSYSMGGSSDLIPPLTDLWCILKVTH